MPAELREAFQKINPDPAALREMFERDKQRMLDFQDWPDDSLRGIKSPTLLIAGDHDVVRPEHAVEIFRLVPNAQLAIVPGADHETIVKNGPRLVSIVVPFLDAPLMPTAGDHR
jgi:pimeloyl-ACP methyl ester carboxylesterase